MKTRIQQLKRYGLLLALPALLAACLDLEHVNAFSKSAVKTMGTYNDIGYSFTYSYYHFTVPSKVYSIPGTPEAMKLPPLTSTDGEPETAMKADAVINTYLAGISAYFASLAKVSDKDLLNYNFDKVTENLKGDDKLRKSLKLEGDDGDKKIDAISSITKVFTTEMTGVYREKKIKKIMIKYDTALGLSMDALSAMLGCLLEAMTNDKLLIDSKYKLLLLDPKLDYGKKVDLLKDYMNEKLALEKSQQQLIKLIEALNKIKEAHHQIVEQLKKGKIDSKQAMALVQKYGAEVFEIYSKIKSIK